MTFQPVVHRINLAGYAARDPARQAELRARAILEAVPNAERRLGSRPTHVLIDGSMRVNLDIIEFEGGLQVRRLPRPKADRLTADLAVAVEEKPVVGQLAMWPEVNA